MNKLLSKLKKEIINLSSNPNFIHHKWFIKYHLEIVEKISLELCEIYSNANKDLVLAIVWMHDYGKIVDFDNQYKATISNGNKFMQNLGFTKKFSNEVIKYIQILDKKENLDISPIEVQIVSSADGASHLVGPFFSIYWYENNNISIDDLMKSNFKKSKLDWEKKVVLPEVKSKFLVRHQLFLEHCGNFPSNYLK